MVYLTVLLKFFIKSVFKVYLYFEKKETKKLRKFEEKKKRF